MFGSLTDSEGDLFRQFDRLNRELEDFLGYPRGPANIRAVARGSYPSINVGSSIDSVDVYVFCAGLDQDRLDVSLQQNLLTLNGECAASQPEGSATYMKERFSGKFRRSISLPEDVDPDTASARYKDGVLHISLKRKAEARPRKIQVN